MEARYGIRPVREADLAMLGGWRSRPHVSRWWGAADVEPETDKLRERRVAMWIAEQGSRPFAFIQDYAISDWSPHHFDFLPLGSRGVDMYIGDPDNLAAIRAFERAGFGIVGGPLDTRWGRAVLMTRGAWAASGQRRLSAPPGGS